MIDPATLKLDMEPRILAALREDINGGDVSTNAVLPTAQPGTATLLAKQRGVVAGLQVFERTFQLLDPATRVTFFVDDADVVAPGDTLATVSGDLRVILSGERTALNFLQRMSGTATLAHAMVETLAGTGIRLVDTRKTTPNQRVFDKYAVRVGGAGNHRYNLSDGVLLKDNHIAAAGGITAAIQAARAYAPFVRKIEVETETLAQVREAVAAGADIIMLDNMDRSTLEAAIAEIAGRAEIEVSGNVTAASVAALRGLKIDYISSGALTHSAGILDLSLKVAPVEHEAEE
ncbi:carboxylating nicotinate-nucleotide diphosphorylase [Neoactinobaculum massilliense]|uniref:carboxylating nicotinate-nucleotide diphosphorylase n=1 Tax=Neoactinobaculum massilliense TaxID=2364794 RepID=UPI000F53D4D9|nr:carboxylating nicotinate-nucleotide diphosphorylase [Neoactinobaculum massilliense]